MKEKTYRIVHRVFAHDDTYTEAVIETGFQDAASARRHLHKLSVYRGDEAEDYEVEVVPET